MSGERAPTGSDLELGLRAQPRRGERRRSRRLSFGLSLGSCRLFFCLQITRKNPRANRVVFPASQFLMRALTIALKLLLPGLLSLNALTLLAEAASVFSSHKLSVRNLGRGRFDRSPPLLLGIILFLGHVTLLHE